LDTNVGGVDRRRRSTSGVRSRFIIRILNGARKRRVHMSTISRPHPEVLDAVRRRIAHNPQSAKKLEDKSGAV
jgi:hypothetical protein